MTKNIIEARTIVKDILNNNLIDPYSGTRRGNQFLDEADELNLDRANTFPKGFITTSNRENIKSNIGPTGHAINSGNINIWYYTKQDVSYTDGVGSYRNADLINYMTDKIRVELEDHINIGSGYHIKTFGKSDGPLKQTPGTFPVWYDIVPITIYWDRVY